MARGHYIKPNTKCETLQHAIWFDTETDQEDLGNDTIGHILFQGWAAYSRRTRGGKWSNPEWFKFTRSVDFWQWVEAHTRVKTRLYLFCHNTNFDLPVLDTFRELPSNGWTADRLVIEAPPTIIRVKRNNHTIAILDTLNYWPMPLKKLGAQFGIDKLDMPPRDAPEEDWDTYNKRDVEIIMKAVQTWSDMIQEYDLGGFQPTLAGQAFNAWRHRFMDDKVLIDDNEEALACSRACYHGGRTEAMFIGKLKGKFTLVDVNSMYPWAMREYTFPTRLFYYSKHVDPSKLKYMLTKHLVCARVTITVDKPAIGVYRNGKFIFPVGTFEANLSTPELRWVIKHGKIHKVHELAAYEHNKIFKRYVDFFYKWRQEAKANGDAVLEYMLKLILNSLYGKFGQRGFRYEIIDLINDLRLDKWIQKDPDSDRVDHYRQLMGTIQLLERESESANSHPAIAAHVTAYARMHLYKFIEKAGAYNVFYTDTDSLLVNDEGLSNLQEYLDETSLGMLKNEGHYDEIEIHGPKDYVFGNKYKCKGVRAGAIWLDPNTVEQDKWSGLKGLLKDKNLSMPLTKRVMKHLNRQYNKGIKGPTGWVIPYPLGGGVELRLVRSGSL